MPRHACGVQSTMSLRVTRTCDWPATAGCCGMRGCCICCCCWGCWYPPHVKGPEQHPLYSALSGKDAAFPGDVKWNFGKFLIGRDGKVIARYDSGVKPDAKELTDAIDKALAAK